MYPKFDTYIIKKMHGMITNQHNNAEIVDWDYNWLRVWVNELNWRSIIIFYTRELNLQTSIDRTNVLAWDTIVKLPRVEYINTIYDERRGTNYVFLFWSHIWCLLYDHKCCFAFIIQLFHRNVTNMTKIINMVTIKSVRYLSRQKIRPRPQAFSVGWMALFTII